jgi:hypothetical protein
MPLEDNEDVNKKFTIWGVLQCFRYMIMHLAELDKSSSSYFSNFSNDNQVNLPNESNSSFNTSTSSNVIKSAKGTYALFSISNLCQVSHIVKK